MITREISVQYTEELKIQLARFTDFVFTFIINIEMDWRTDRKELNDVKLFVY